MLLIAPATSSTAHAIVINCECTWTVGAIIEQTACPNLSGTDELHIDWFTCKEQHGQVASVEIGDTFKGRFQIGQEVSGLSHGVHNTELISYFVRVGELDFAYNRPTNVVNWLDMWRQFSSWWDPRYLGTPGFSPPSNPTFFVEPGQLRSIVA